MAKKKIVSKKSRVVRSKGSDSVLFSVTPVSRGIAFALFIVFPLIAFALGVQYFQKVSTAEIDREMELPQYLCPAVQKVDCVVPISEENQEMCKPQFLTWAEDNCPSFEGAQY
ncbi:hypothetical protein COU88_01990 [Candidatus Roizmanbacteria bacterium CG10_big_fil_rev_8_21_14_0_10_39_6]|uniref:Uncharacterized protein n=1 Tax=Candidatus Roizmanbacteria bacterium CG10_big_fil_rev_8_21_14_0_10_39_6 TaxID=1974853 RepID=A0A2M8KSS2_9BACT|nr:MAG: hypothetical protein COU88_01990 [Candidatus Roizmanbacteria bacterium CG10_big_fil_rev_8_21_14_0_10_39_6]